MRKRLLAILTVIKAVLSQVDAGKRTATERFVARPHIREVKVGHDVRGDGENLVAHVVPEKQYAMWASTQETRTVDHVSVAPLDGLEEPEVIVGVIFQVGVLHDHDLAFLLPEIPGAALRLCRDSCPERRRGGYPPAAPAESGAASWRRVLDGVEGKLLEEVPRTIS
jgi:hypothetical protein